MSTETTSDSDEGREDVRTRGVDGAGTRGRDGAVTRGLDDVRTQGVDDAGSRGQDDAGARGVDGAVTRGQAEFLSGYSETISAKEISAKLAAKVTSQTYL